MPSTRHKLTRKELKQPDEFQTIIESAQEFLLDNLRQVIISAAVVLLAGIIAAGSYFYETHRDRVSGEAFYNAMAELAAKQYKPAQAAFTSVATNYPNRRVGKLAQLYLAQAYLGAGDLPKARDALIEFVANYHDAEFSSLALTNLGVVYEDMGDLAKAEGAYRQAASIPGPQQDRALLELGRVQAERGETAAAIQTYRGFLEARPYSQQREEVVASLAMLGAGPTPSVRPPSGALPVMVPPAAPGPHAEQAPKSSKSIASIPMPAPSK